MTIIRVWPAEGGARVFVYISYTENTRSSVLICQRVHSLSHDGLFATPWNVAHQASLSVNSFCNLLKLMSIKSVMPFNHLILCQPLLLSSVLLRIRSSLMSQLFASGGQSIGASASASVLPMNIQDWFPLGLTGWVSLQSKGLSRDFSNTTVQKHQFNSMKQQSTTRHVLLSRKNWNYNNIFSI